MAVLPFVLLFGSGVLSKSELSNVKTFQWHLILLVGGGSVLGSAVNSSQLLTIASAQLKPLLIGLPLFWTTLTVLVVVFVITTFISHTVAALIMSPLIINIGAQSGSVQVLTLVRDADDERNDEFYRRRQCRT